MAYTIEHCSSEDLLDEVYENIVHIAESGGRLDIDTFADPYKFEEGERKIAWSFAEENYGALTNANQIAKRELHPKYLTAGKRRAAGIGCLIGAALGYAAGRLLGGNGAVLGGFGALFGVWQSPQQ
ncbi:MAG: hypothetical protein ABIJ20_03590 [Nanoarchaeota archaeon]|nr:hypothetical protein [Nanoarchaeota archaeon]MBU1444762.1 hypothetical protein [Nanoarchaeota archaeon]MBU2474891.1 hypothetical protein [Nanoarchaeota archaeon]